MNTFQLIFGDYQQAKELWTGLANELWEVFASGAEGRNEMLKEWQAAGGRDDLFGGIAETWNSIKEIIDTVKDAFNEFFGMEEKVFGIAEAYVGPDGKLTAGMQKTTSIFYGITKAIKEFGERTKAWVSVEQNLEKIRRIANGVFAILNFGKKIISGIFSSIKTGISGFDGNSFLEIIASIADKIVEIEEKIDLSPIFERLGNALKALTSGVSEFISTIFVSYAEGGGGVGGIFSVIIDSFNVLVRTVSNVISALTGMDASSVVERFIIEPFQAAREFILGFIDNVKKLGEINIKMPDLSGLKNAVGEVISTLNPLEKIINVFKGLFNGLKTIFGPVADIVWNAAKRIGKSIWGMIDSILKAMEEGDFNKVVSMINSGVFTYISFQMAGLSKSITVLGKSFAGLKVFSLKGMMEALKDPQKLLGQAADGIKSLAAAILPMSQEDEPNILWNFAKSLALLTASLYVLSTIDSKKLGESLTALTTLFADLVASVKILGTGGHKVNVTRFSLLKMASAVLVLSFALKNIATLDVKQIGNGLMGLTGMLTIVIGSLKILQGIDTKKATAGLLGMSVAMVVMAASMKIFGSMELDEIANALAAFAGSMIIIIKSFDMLDSKGIIKAAGSIFIMSEAMLRMSIAMKIFGTMGIEDIALALTAFAGSMVIIVAAFNSISDKALLKTSAGMFIMSEAMLRMSIGLKLMASLGLEGLVIGLAAFAGTILILVKAFNSMSPTNIVLMAEALDKLGFAMWGMGSGLADMAKLGLKGVASSLIAFGGALAIVYVAIEKIKPEKMSQFAGSMALLGLSMIALGAGLAALSLSGIGLVGVIGALLSLGAVVGVFAALSKVIGPATITAMLNLAGALVVLGGAMLLTGLGLAALAAGMVAFSVAVVSHAAAFIAAVNVVIVGILDTLANIAPALVRAVVAIMEAICTGIMQHDSILINTVLTLLASIIESILSNGSTIITGTFKIIVMLLEGLVEYTPQIIDLVVDFIIGVLDGLGKRMGDLLNAVKNTHALSESWVIF